MSIGSPVKSLRQWRHNAAGTPFGRLVAHFLHKTVRASDLDLGVGGLLGLLAAPGAFATVLMMEKYSAFLNWLRGHVRNDVIVASIPDKYLFLSVAMAVTGIVTVLQWDRILPDSQDYLNLAPLPVRPRRVLAANAAAILIAALAIAVDVNAVPSLLFPFLVVSSAFGNVGDFVGFAAAHIGAVALASAFSIGSVFALLGTASALLPRRVIRACGSWLRGALLLAFVALLLSGFAGRDLWRLAQSHPESPVRFLPSLWFLAVYQELQHRATPLVAQMAGYAARGAAAVCLLAVASYGLSYRRRFAAVLEAEGRPSRRRLLRAVLAVLDFFAPRRPGLTRAAHRFVVRALLRSETHRLAIAVALGLGWMAAFADPAAGPLAMAYLLILGLRVAFELPAAIPANWIFRVILDPRRAASPGVARRVIFSFLVPLVLAPAFAVLCREDGWRRAAFRICFTLAFSAGLIEALLAGYRKLPLTCPMPGFRERFPVLCLVQFLGFAFFTRGAAALEAWMWQQPWRLVLLPAAMTAAWWWNRARLAEARENGELEEGLTFENAPEGDVQLLGLSDAG